MSEREDVKGGLLGGFDEYREDGKVFIFSPGVRMPVKQPTGSITRAHVGVIGGEGGKSQ